MAKRLHFFIQGVLVVLALIGASQGLHAQCGPGEDMTPPEFVDDTTDLMTITVCFSEIPEPDTYTADDNCDGIFEVTASDNRPPDSVLCNIGGNIRRQWRAVDAAGNANPTTIEQLIIVTPDTDDPVVNYQPNSVIASCATADFQGWLDEQMMELEANSTDNCGIASITNSANSEPPCNQAVEIVFSVTDFCGNSVEFRASYTIQDNAPPVLQDIPADVTLDCSDPIPAPPNVTATDACDGGVPVDFTEDISTPTSANCADYTITRTWTAEDDCGNSVTETQVITIMDETAPSFTIPADTVVACGSDLSILTGVTDIQDNCDPDIPFPAGNGQTTLIQIIHNTQANGLSETIDVYLNGQLAANNLNYRTATPFIEAPAGVPLSVAVAPANSTSAQDTVPGLSLTRTLSADSIYVVMGYGVFGSVTYPFSLAFTGMGRTQASAADAFDALFLNGSPDSDAMDLSVDMSALVDDLNYPEIPSEGYVSLMGDIVNVDVLEGPGMMNLQSFSLDLTKLRGQAGVIFTSGFVNMANQPPEFDVLIALADGAVFSISETGGMPTNLLYGTNTVSFQLDTTSMRCDSFIVEKIWTVEDACGNATSMTQVIELIDTIAPTFVTPPDITVNCEQADDLGITGEPTMLDDNCDPSPELTFEDVFAGTGCINGGTLFRVWIATDACGNVRRDTQDITIDDQVAPEITTDAMDLNLLCTTDLSIQDTFNRWIAAQGNAIAEDACTPDSLLTWMAFNTGTSDTAALPAPSCPGPGSGVYLEQSVDFIVMDECGNSDTTTAVFQVVDNMAPVFEYCPPDTTIENMPGECGSDFVLPLPIVTEECGESVNVNVSMTQPIASDLPGDEETPVNPIQFDLSVPAIPTYAFDSIRLMVRLLSVDGNQASEYFNILSENGIPLGRTQNVAEQCDTSMTVLLDLTAAQINRWAVDGVITIRLEPNIPDNQPGRFAINDICPGAEAEIMLSYKAKTPQNVTYEYSLNNNTRMTYDPASTAPSVMLDADFNTIKYFATDCVGNVDSCSFIVTVNDVEAPTFDCPMDISTMLGQDSCTDEVTLPLPMNLADNCDMPDSLAISYFTTGATTIGETALPNPTQQPTVVLNGGMTEVFYIVKDLSGNQDTCSFNATVIDDQAPEAVCGSTTIFINPSGVMPDTISAMEIDAGSTDNCGIVNMEVTPSVFTCDLAGQDTVNVTLTVFDAAGNSSSCSVPVRVVTESPEPTFFVEPCGGDTLFLFANPPAAPGNIIYTYRWSGPNGFVSNLRNPFIPNPDEDNAGSYEVTITGITECVASGVVEVAIADVPITPSLDGPNAICSNDDLILTTTAVPLNNVEYQWYTGVPPNGTLVQTTTTPTLMLPPPHNAGNAVYYVQIVVNGCSSVESPAKTVQVTQVPTAVIASSPNDPLCEGEMIRLEAQESTMTGLTYSWSGPNSFMSNARVVTVTESATLANSGVYNLEVSKNGCVSETTADSRAQVTVTAKPPRPLLTNNGPVCEGDEVTLITNVSNATSYNWIAPDFDTITTPSNRLTLSGTDVIDAGNWTIFVTRGGCASDLSQPSLVEINGTPTLTLSASPSTVCSGTDLQLFASPALAGASYEWTGPDGFFSVAQNPTLPNVTIARSGTYTCTVTTANGCSTTRTVEVEVLQGVEIVGISSDGQGCLAGAQNVRLAVTTNPEDNGSYQYEWTGPNGFTSTNRVAVIPNASEADNGNYQVRVTNGAGCISAAATTTISVRRPPVTPAAPSISPLTPAPFCEENRLILTTATNYSGSDIMYSWSTPLGVIQTEIPSLTLDTLDVNDSGDYSLSVSIDGCPSNSSGITPITVTAKPTVFPGSNSPVCEGERLMLTANQIQGATYQWSGPSGITSGGRTPSFSNVTPDIHDGTYTVQATVNGCPSEPVSTEVMVTPTPQRPGAVNDSPLCITSFDADDVELRLAVPASTATPGATYTWYDENDEVIGSTDNLILIINDFSNFSTGEFDYTVEARVGDCVSERSMPTTVEIYVLPKEGAMAGPDFSICRGQPVFLNATPPTEGRGFWEIVPGNNSDDVVILNPDTASTEVIGIMSDTTTYQFVWNLAIGTCGVYSRDTVAVTVNDAEVAMVGDMIDTCQVTSLRLNAIAPSGGEGRWIQSEAQAQLGVLIENPNDPNTEVFNLQPGNQYLFTWSLTNTTCGETTAELTVLVSGGFPFAGEDFGTCDECVVLNATQPSTGVGVWSTPDASIFFNSRTDAKTTVCGLKTGENLLVWTVDNAACGSASRDSVIITVAGRPMAQNDALSIQTGELATIDVAANDVTTAVYDVTVVEEPVNGTLELLDNGIYEYQSDPNFRGRDEFTYEICNRDVKDCTCDTATVVINVRAPGGCLPPNVFTPNNDGINDTFIIACFTGPNADDFRDNEVIIVNQWGDEVFRADNYQNDWAGTYNGEDLPNGTYFYIVKYGDVEFGAKVETGYVVIQR